MAMTGAIFSWSNAWCGDAAEANDGRGARHKFDNFIIQFLELPGITTGGLAKGMKVFEGGGVDMQLVVPRMNLVQGQPVALYVLLRLKPFRM